MSWRIRPMPLSGPLFDGAVRVYGDAFAEPPYCDPDRGAEVRDRLRHVHSQRPGFRALIAVIEPGDVIGMAYGYHGGPGQFWHDSVARKLGEDGEQTWLADAYELVEIAVSPAWQNRGGGSALIDALLQDVPNSTCVLSTRSDSRAHRLYSRKGFQHLIEMEFARGGEQFYVMGKVLR